MPVFLIFLAAWLGFLPATGSAADAAAAASQSTLQNRCFCIQYTGKWPSPYFIGRLTPATAECANAKYQAEEGKGPQDSGLLTCDELKKCNKGAGQYAKKKITLNDKTAQAREKLAGCGAPGLEGEHAGPQADPKCAANWEAAIKYLAAEMKKVEGKERDAWGLCYSGREKNPKGKTAAGKTRLK